jgi:signal transduction histidine kinase/sensor domain CHASE-containing protein/ActR/RegA family two-component response regulator
MQNAPIPDNDEARVKALRKLGLLDSVPEERFDRLTRITQKTLSMPIALISLVDNDRQWFKSKLGINAIETERCISFCGHAILGKDIFVVENALVDERFKDNPLVCGELGLRFYAGRPLFTTKGYCIGTLCVIDTKARTFDSEQRLLLDDLAKLVEQEVASVNTDRRASGRVQSINKQSAIKHSDIKKSTSPSRTKFSEYIEKKIIVVLIALLVLAMILFFSYSWHQKNLKTIQAEKNSSAIESLANIRGKIETEINSRLHLTQGLAGLVRANKTVNNEQFQEFAEHLGNNLTSVRSLQLAPAGVVKLVWPFKSNQSAIGHDLMADPERLIAAQKAINARTIWIAGPVNLIQGGVALIARLPIFLPSKAGESEVFWGFASILIDMPEFIKEIGLDNELWASIISIRGKDSEGKLGEVFFGFESTIRNSLASAEVSLPAGSWEVSIKNTVPISHWKGQQLFWILSILLSILLPCFTYFLLRLPQKFRRAVVEATGALQQSEIRFRDAIEALPDGFVIFDENDKLVTCNERFREVYQKTREVIQEGRSFTEILRYGFDKGQYLIEKNQQLNVESFVKQRVELHNRPGAHSVEQLHNGTWIRMVERPIRGGGTVGLRVDITELKLKEKQLAQSRDIAEEANKTKSRFLATVSHEVRTPMNVILGLLEILKSSKSIVNTEQKYIHTAYQSAQQLLHILNEILDISKIEAGKFELEIEAFDLKKTIDSVINLSNNRAADKNLELVSFLNTDPDLVIKGDKGRLQQILLNIVTNAIKFTDKGKVTVTVSPQKLVENDIIISFEVKDTGIGFNNEQAKKLFEPFVQLDNSASRMQEGTGLGLSICQKLLELMGGKISAKGKCNQGATFSFQVPFKIASVDDIKCQRNIKIDNQVNHQPINQSLKILLAEDSPSNQMVFQAMLADTHYAIDIVGNGKAAFEAVKHKSYDLVLMDIFMPEMDGIEATKLIRKNIDIAYVPIIALTANAMKGDREKFINAGMDDYLPKPIDKARLLKKIILWGNHSTS